MIEDCEACDKMFNEVDDGQWDTSDDEDNDLRSNTKKESDKVKANIKEMKLFSTFVIVMFC